MLADIFPQGVDRLGTAAEDGVGGTGGGEDEAEADPGDVQQEKSPRPTSRPREEEEEEEEDAARAAAMTERASGGCTSRKARTFSLPRASLTG